MITFVCLLPTLFFAQTLDTLACGLPRITITWGHCSFSQTIKYFKILFGGVIVTPAYGLARITNTVPMPKILKNYWPFRFRPIRQVHCLNFAFRWWQVRIWPFSCMTIKKFLEPNAKVVQRPYGHEKKSNRRDWILIMNAQNLLF